MHCWFGVPLPCPARPFRPFHSGLLLVWFSFSFQDHPIVPTRQLFRWLESVVIDLVAQFLWNGEQGGFRSRHSGDAASGQLAHNIQGQAVLTDGFLQRLLPFLRNCPCFRGTLRRL